MEVENVILYVKLKPCDIGFRPLPSAEGALSLKKILNRNYITKIYTMTTPTPSIIHKVRLLHKDIYTTGNRLSKRDKLGIHQDVERLTLEMFSRIVEAAFTNRDTKRGVLEIARVRLELLKNIMRTENELGVVDQRTYLRFAEQTVEISRMLNGWISFATKKKPY